MNRFFPIFYILLTGCIPTSETFTPPPSEKVVVTYVVDGDTIEVEFGNGETERVRIIGIDAKEKDECYFEEATAYLKEAIEGEYVSMTRNKRENRDKYERLLRYVRSTDGDIGLSMLTLGYAKNYPWFRHDREQEYTQAELLAKASQMGLWGGCE